MTKNTFTEPERIRQLRIPGRPGAADGSVRHADLNLLALAAEGFLDTTHFDTVRFPPPSWAGQTFDQASKDGTLAYTGYRGHPGVLNSVAEAVSEFLGFPVDAKQNLAFTPGTQAGLFASLSSLIENGDRVALTDPDYLFSERILRFLGAEIGNVPLVLTPGDPHPDFDALETEFAEKGTRYFVFSHPNNPTGAVFSRAVLTRIADLAQRFDVTVVVDELYARLVYPGVEFTHLAALPGMQERTVTLLGPSKTESLSGYRLGVVVAPPMIAERIENVLSITSLRAPAYAQHLLVPWLREDRAWLAERIVDLSALREATIRSLRRLPWLRLEPQQGTAYVWVNVEALGLSGPAVAQKLLTDAGVLVSPGYQFGPSSEGFFRLCYARDEAQWTAALDRIVSVLHELAISQGLEGAG
jgi:aspartate/methionine/tyrosine aminotransferase